MVILKKSVPGLSATALAKFLARAGRAVGMQGVVNVMVTTNRDLQTLNSRFRGKDRPTDVLSFAPMPGVVPNLAGDIAISAEIATQSARQLGHPAAQEIKILALHGILHLAGYDHESDAGTMARKEVRLRKLLGLPSALIERSEPKASLKRARRHPSRSQPSNVRSFKKP